MRAQGKMLAAACLGALWAAAAGSAATTGLRVIPFPGTPDAAPSSPVIFSAVSPGRLRSVSVIGSRSGRHLGRLQRLPAGAGTAFVPARPFAAGEIVSVSARLISSNAAAAEGASGTRLSFWFRVAPSSTSPGPEPGPLPGNALEDQSWMSGKGGPVQSFHSERQLHPPVLSVTSDPDLASGDIFLGPQNSLQPGPMILDGQGQLVWFHPIAHGSSSHYAGNVQVQRYSGRPVLTWWQGTAVDGVITGASSDVIMNRAYREVAMIHAANGYSADLHEFQLTPDGTAYLDAPVLTRADLSSVGGPRSGPVMDYVIQEIDVRTGRLLWEWHALGHVPVSASYLPYSSQEHWYDFFHLNSIQPLPSGNLLVSARDTDTVYEISRATGKVIWQLGGKHSDFTMGSGTNFEWQHDARLHGATLSLFDDAAYPQEEHYSSAMLMHLDLQTRTVTLLRRFSHDPPIVAGAGGSVRTLANGNVFVGWGSVPEFSEYTSSGQQIFNGTFASYHVVSYRAIRSPWVGDPHTRPSLAVSQGTHGRVKIYASWNGATQVTAWRVLGGTSARDLQPLGVRARQGFETEIRLTTGARYFAVQALDNRRSVLRTSATVRG